MPENMTLYVIPFADKLIMENCRSFELDLIYSAQDTVSGKHTPILGKIATGVR